MDDVDDILSAVASRFGTADGLERVEGMLRIRAGEIDVPRPALQWGAGLYMPGLTAKPWHEADDLPWVHQVESSFDLIRAEFEALPGRDGVEPYLPGFDLELQNHPTLKAHEALSEPASDGAAWTIYFLTRFGKWVDANAQRCPHTCMAIASTPLSLGESLFSVLAARSEITLHNGSWNMVLTCHIGLAIPEGCGIRVGTEERTWQAGKVLVFDDTFAHSAWNTSDETRSCLIWDVWHPDMTPLEIEAMHVVLPLLSS